MERRHSNVICICYPLLHVLSLMYLKCWSTQVSVKWLQNGISLSLPLDSVVCSLEEISCQVSNCRSVLLQSLCLFPEKAEVKIYSATTINAPTVQLGIYVCVFVREHVGTEVSVAWPS